MTERAEIIWKWAVALCVLAVMYLIIVYSGDPLDARERDFNARLEAVIARNERSVKIAGLTQFDWHRVCLVTQYAVPAQFRDKERQELTARGAFNLPWVGKSNEWGLIFVISPSETRGIRISPHVDVPERERVERAGIPFVTDPDGRPVFCYARDEATFSLFTSEERQFAYLTRR
jgi:hypothetical protein